MCLSEGRWGEFKGGGVVQQQQQGDEGTGGWCRRGSVVLCGCWNAFLFLSPGFSACMHLLPSFPSFLTPPLSFQLCGQRFISRLGSTVPPRGE